MDRQRSQPAASRPTPPVAAGVEPSPVASHFPEPAAPETNEHEDEHSLEWVDLARIGLVALAVVVSWLRLWQPAANFDAVALAATLVGGYPIFREALAALFARRMTMELS